MSIKRSAVAGVKWTSTSAIATAGMQFARLAIVAHLLSSDDFGLMAMMMVVLGFAQAFSDMGISNAIICKHEVGTDQLSSLYWANWLSGLITFVGVSAAAPLVAQFYREPRLERLILVAALTFLIAPLGQQSRVLLQRDLQFRTLSIIEIAAAFFGSVVSIALALLDKGVYALVLGQVATVVVQGAFSAAVGWRRWRPRMTFSRNDLNGFLGFGAYQMAERSINYVAANFDYIVIGRVLGPIALGPYYAAYQLAISPLLRVNPILTRVAFPILARRQADNAILVQGYLEISHFLALITFPILVGMAAAAPVLVPVLLGRHWNDAVPLTEMLAFVGLFKILGNPSGSILLAKGRADIGFWWNIFVAAANLGIFSLVVSWGPVAVAAGYVALSVVYFVLILSILGRLIALSWRQYLALLMRPAIAALVMAVVVRGTWTVVSPLVDITVWSAASFVLLGGLVYSLSVFCLERPYLARLSVLLLNR